MKFVGSCACYGGVGSMKSCFMFGHRNVPDTIQEQLMQAVERLYLEKGISIFYVGRYGMFDSCAAAAVKAVREQFPEISLYRVTPYHPAVRPVILPEGYDGSFYPPLEGVPQRYAILKANQYMVKTCDAVICLKHYGNSKGLLELAIRRAQKDQLIIENIGQYFCADDEEKPYKA